MNTRGMKTSRRTRDDLLYVLIGSAIENLRIQQKLTQSRLAEKCGLTRTSITHIVRGKQRLPLDRLFTIAEALGVSARILLPDSRPTGTTSGEISDRSMKRIEDIINKLTMRG